MVALIWGHSVMPAEISQQESGFLSELINSIFGEGVITEHMIRKLAHFTEYMLLALLCAADLTFYDKKGALSVLAVLYICLLVSVIDESIQLFSLGRSGMLFDVWLDHLGSITGVGVFCVIKRIIKK